MVIKKEGARPKWPGSFFFGSFRIAGLLLRLGDLGGGLEAGDRILASADDQFLGHGLGLAIHINDGGKLVKVVLTNLQGRGGELTAAAGAVGFVVINQKLGVLGELNNHASLHAGGNLTTLGNALGGGTGFDHGPLNGASLDSGGFNDHTAAAAVAAAATKAGTVGVGATVAATAAVVGAIASVAAGAASATVAGVNGAVAATAGINHWGANRCATGKAASGLVAEEEIRSSGRADHGGHNNG